MPRRWAAVAAVLGAALLGCLAPVSRGACPQFSPAGALLAAAGGGRLQDSEERALRISCDGMSGPRRWGWGLQCEEGRLGFLALRGGTTSSKMAYAMEGKLQPRLTLLALAEMGPEHGARCRGMDKGRRQDEDREWHGALPLRVPRREARGAR